MAKQQNDAGKKVVGKTYVTSSFRHKDDFDQEYEVGQDISDEDEGRLAELIEKGLAETYAEPAK
jgi:CRISPR/Cas system-associated protein Cas10 (large subunit of type III CRISPR-Cas system)